MATPIPSNACAFALAEVVAATGAQVRLGAASHFSGITTDSRGDATGKLFVALAGESFDGHRFVEQAVGAGASGVLVERDDVAVSSAITSLRVESSLEALGALGALARRRWAGKLVAIAGSAGKTTTKSAIGAALSELCPGAVHVTPGNLNNRVGVPMVLFGLTDQHRFAVIEIGTNTSGEVAALTAMCAPDLAVLTLIDLEHSEGLGDLDAIEVEEGSLLLGLSQAGIAIVNVDDPRAARQLGRAKALRKFGYGIQSSADYRVLERVSSSLTRSRIRLARPSGAPISLETSLFGSAGALAIAASVAVVEALVGQIADPSALSRAFSAPGLTEPGRLAPLCLADDTLLLDDTYNANPASVKSSLDAARELASRLSRRLVLVIGEMRELGEFSERAHLELAAELARSGAAVLIAVSGDAALFTDAAKKAGVEARFAKDAEAALAAVLELSLPGDVVLVKASRGVRTERVVQGFVSAKGRAA